ncbi:DinB family protein [Mucilaginibacter sp. UR6-1]|uniref:DinB family protein n=1 Tax=Mucilaginibacter sp. UR6-1 TaxID=1435643 RepID=UPI001E36F8BA|nr:DinB family protein [Mucilaginibacter sp. UR6-1]MCC8410982.1 DinB family protein [Mucilaginibacter sp. UR6-1]
MKIIPMLVKEMAEEAVTTRKMLSIIPADKFDWQPHPKSMSLRQLASHIGELPAWVTMVLNTTGLDFAQNGYTEHNCPSVDAAIELFEQNLAGAQQQLEKATEDDLLPDWTLRNGDIVYVTCSKAEMIRTTFCQLVHHRAQLGVFLRLLDIPIPGSYGPSADEMQVYDMENAG